MFNKKIFSMIKCLKCFVFHFDIFDIVQRDNGKKFKKTVLIFLKNNAVKVINERFRIFRTQKLMKQANGIMKNKIKKKIEITENSRRTQHFIRLFFIMNAQKHDNLFYKMSLYEVFFGRKYFYRFNNFVTIKKLQTLNKKKFTDDAIDTYCVEVTSNARIKNIFNQHLKHESENKTNENEKKSEAENDDVENKSQKEKNQ